MKTIKQNLYTYAVLTHGRISFDVSCSSGMEAHGWLLIKTEVFETEIEDIDYKNVILKREVSALAKQRDQLDLQLEALKSGR